MGQKTKKPHKIFEAHSRYRRILWLLAAWLAVFGLIVWFSDFVYRIYNMPPLPDIDHSFIEEAEQNTGPSPVIALDPLSTAGCGVGTSDKQANEGLLFAYLPFNDGRASAGLSTRCGQIDMLLYEAYTFGNISGAVRSLDLRYEDSLQFDLSELERIKSRDEVYLVLRTLPNIPVETVEAMLEMPDSRDRFLDSISDIAVNTRVAGICLDLSDLPDIAPGPLAALFNALVPESAVHGFDTCLIGTPDAGFWQTPEIVQNVDRAIVLAFQEHTTPQDPLAPLAWSADALSTATDTIPQEKLVVALGSFGVRWQSGQALPQTVSYAETMWLAGRHQGDVSFVEDFRNTHVMFLDDQRRRNRIWLLDAASMFNQLHSLPKTQNVAVWPLGYEDPAIWSLLADRPDAPWVALQAPVALDNQVIFQGEGPIVTTARPSVDGVRTVQTGADGNIRAQTYDTLPAPVTVSRIGSSDSPALIVTFNNLPRPKPLVQLLETLDRYDIQATFFLHPKDLLKYEDVIPQMLASGHTLGAAISNDVSGSWSSRVFTGFSNNRMQHLFTFITSQRAVLVRDLVNPYVLPRDQSELADLQTLLDDGYLPVLGGISPRRDDFDSAAFVDYVREVATLRDTTVLSINLLADSTVDVVDGLSRILPTLQSDGFRFLTIPQLAGLDESDVMPIVPTPHFWRDNINYSALSFFFFGMADVFFVLLIVAMVRSITYLILSLVKQRKVHPNPDFQPEVAVLVPAFNEESVIVSCINSILDSDYPNFKIVVIDDGSTDNTAAIVLETFGDNPLVTLLQQENMGKSSAHNHAIKHLDVPFFLGIDADTVLMPDAITKLVPHFEDERVGAVAGFVEVGNRKSILTSFQTLEYLIGQDVFRRASQLFNGILVVPGSVGAWRTEAVRKAGNYSGETMVEDADLTVAIQRIGYRVRFQDDARAYTESPSSIRTFMRQRLRWTLGMLQIAWKHRGAVLQGLPVGFVSIIDAAIFILMTGLFSPVVDLVLISIFFNVTYDLVTSGEVIFATYPIIILISYFVLVLIDMLYLLVVFRFERRFDWRLLALVPVLRFGYRQLLYISSLRAIGRALTGRLSGWQKLERTGAAHLPDSPDS